MTWTLIPNRLCLDFKVKSDLLEKFVKEFVQTPAGQHGVVGDYYVLATNEDTFKLI